MRTRRMSVTFGVCAMGIAIALSGCSTAGSAQVAAAPLTTLRPAPHTPSATSGDPAGSDIPTPSGTSGNIPQPGDVFAPGAALPSTESGSLYWLLDGSYVYVSYDSTAPLPASVSTDIQVRLNLIPHDTDNPFGADSASYNFSTANQRASTKLLTDAGTTTSKNIVLIRLTNIGLPGTAAGSVNSLRWFAESTQSQTIQVFEQPAGQWTGWGNSDSDKPALRARLDKWISTQSNPASWAVFVQG